MSVQTRYEAEIAAGTMRPDPAQAAAVSRLQALLDRLASAPAPRPKTGLLARLGRRLGSAPPAPVQRIVSAEREMNYCPGCQTDGKLLRDRSLSRLLKDDWPDSV